MNTVAKTIKYIKTELRDLYPPQEISGFIRILFEEYLSLDAAGLIRESEKKIQANVLKSISDALERLKTFEPVQYITGNTFFTGLKFSVNSSVLIPRPETEELTDLIIKNTHENRNKLRIIDIGTGSGCIAVSLAKYIEESEVYAVDISEDALTIAQINAKNNVVEIQFFKDDILNPKSEINELKFDIIVSNPPYVTISEKKSMLPNVLNYEPYRALFVPDNDPLIFYRHIIDFAEKKLSPQGKLYFEINENFGKEVSEAIQNKYCFKQTEILKDISGKDRFAAATKIS
jgi:release factor glutamine methyltransferase